MTNLVFDFHTHHHRCGHARGELRDYIEAAIAKGLHMIGLSDHSPFFGNDNEQPFPTVAMAKKHFPEYVAEVLKLKEEYKGKIDVLLGVESDFFPKQIDLYRQQFARYPFDYIIGSVHFVRGMSIFNKERWDRLTREERIETKEAYYNLVAESAQSGLFQILGHIDAMKAFYPAFSEIPTDVVNQTLKVIGASEVAIEINTSGKTKDCGGWYPADELLERALHYGVKVTFGSDAHDPERVADEFEEVKTRLKEIGFKEWAYFKQKKMYLTTL
ncbi:histidinol-phosphatase [Bacillus sp. FJAT-50079]|uniref:histidinol-phosphatase n=1 Tax=Bacillus sp. FJAT-50079 TaxID=2833577 RepID=UPI001BC9BD16|nr:histidinol-phosphatase [Bacillus sp. FJAT-50079]MBS4210395.1 histidinol-phosphatase [Bacillus sp. FJAT-50079]